MLQTLQSQIEIQNEVLKFWRKILAITIAEAQIVKTWEPVKNSRR